MMRLALVAATMTIGATQTALAQGTDSAAFIIRLGRDTTAVERYVRTPSRLVAEAVSRAPTTVVHRLVIDFAANGSATRGEYSVRPASGGGPTMQRTVVFRGDSAFAETTQAGRTQSARAAAAGAIPLAGPFYSPYELAIMQAIAANRPSSTILAGLNPVVINVQRVGRDSVALNNQFNEPLRAHIDARGRILHLQTPAYATVTRQRWIDLDALTREFAARDQTGKSLGALSPRMTFRRTVHGANLWLDYGRPGMRGRPVWGGLVPWDQVWRMGANDAAHFATDRTLELGNLTIAAGTYTLFLKPAQTGGWELIVNRGTGISGLAYDPAVDLGEVPLQVTTLAEPVEWFTIDITPGQQGSGTIVISWDRTQATASFRVR